MCKNKIYILTVHTSTGNKTSDIEYVALYISISVYMYAIPLLLFLVMLKCGTTMHSPNSSRYQQVLSAKPWN